ncbi:MAG TPA: hypothetical protein PKI46_00115 [Bacteroidales bacterium]|nr:hypothetical protein [Bacteroidales bacterium]
MRKINFIEKNGKITEVNCFTEKGIAQIAKWQEAYNEAIANEERLENKLHESKSDILRSHYRKLTNQAWNKAYKIIEKVEDFAKYGLTTTEIKKLADINGTLVSLDKDIIGTEAIKVAYFDYLKIYVKYSFHRYSGIMSNVRGCKSLAGKKEIRLFEVITKEEYENYINGPKTTTTTFMGSRQVKVTPAKYNDMGAEI